MSKGCLPLLTSLYFALGPQWQNVAPPFTAAVVGAFPTPTGEGKAPSRQPARCRCCKHVNRSGCLWSGLQNPLWNLVYQTAGCRTPASAQGARHAGSERLLLLSARKGRVAYGGLRRMLSHDVNPAVECTAGLRAIAGGRMKFSVTTRG